MFDVSAGDNGFQPDLQEIKDPKLIKTSLSNPTPDWSVISYKASTKDDYQVCFQWLTPGLGDNSTSSPSNYPGEGL